MSRAGEFNQHLGRAARRVSDFHPPPVGVVPHTGWLPRRTAPHPPVDSPFSAAATGCLNPAPNFAGGRSARTHSSNATPRADAIALRHTNFDPRTKLIFSHLANFFRTDKISIKLDNLSEMCFCGRGK